MSEPYPLVFQPMLLEKVWGGRRLASLGKSLPEGALIGESWEVADLSTTAESGGGGGPRRSVIAGGALAGKTIQAAMRQWGGGMLGSSHPADDGGFPLLVKFIDARQHLSVQVHPTPEFAASHTGSTLKTECWYVLAAETGERGEEPVIFKGFKPGVTMEDYRASIAAGTVPELLNAVPAIPGEMHDLPSGTIHALGAGVMVAEVQTPSDTTFRVFDWIHRYNRPARELHVAEALESTLFEEPPASMSVSGDGDLVRNGRYSVRQLKAHCEEKPVAGADRCSVLVVLQTMGASLASKAGRFAEIALDAGRTVLIPAACAGDVVLRGGPGTKALVVEAV